MEAKGKGLNGRQGDSTHKKQITSPNHNSMGHRIHYAPQYHTHVEMHIYLSTASSAPFFHATKISQLMLSTVLQRKITLSNWSPKLNVSTSAPQILRMGTIKAPIRKKGGASKQRLDDLNL